MEEQMPPILGPSRGAGFSLKRLRRRALEARQRENLELNSREFAQRRVILSSTPRRVFLQINAACNADCVFCSKGYDYPIFGFQDYEKIFGGTLSPVISRSRELVLTGSGEFLGLPDAERILRNFNDRFPHVDKYIATNASHRSRIFELIAESGGRYTLQISLHSTDGKSHRLMMRYNAYPKVMENIRYLAAQRKKGHLRINLMFIMTTLNAEELPDFVRLGAELGVDKIIAGYFYIYESQQKYLSLYFKQNLANRMIDAAREVAADLEVDVRLPPKFGKPSEAAVRPDCCSEPWQQIMVNADGRILPCDVYGSFNENLREKCFMEIWNGPAYREIRRALSNNEGCIATCPRQNSGAINHWRAHVIHRPKEDGQIVKEFHEAMRKP